MLRLDDMLLGYCDAVVAGSVYLGISSERECQCIAT